MLGVIKPQKPPSLADRLRREIDAAADSPAQNKPQPKFNAFSNNETSPPVPAKELQFIDLTTSPFVVPASESATSENAASTTTIPAATPEKEREKIASDPAPSVVSPSKYDDIVSFLSRKGDEPLTKEDAAKLESLIKSKTEGVNIESQKISASPVINPFSQSVALELSDLAPKPPVARLPSPQPKAAQLFQPPADVPMFTFGVSASSAPTASGSLFGSSKPLFAPVFTFSAKASATTSTSSSAVTSRATLTAPSSSSSTLGTRTRRTFRAPGQYTGASFGNTTAAQRRRLAAPTTRTVSSTSSDVPTWSLSSSSNGNGMDISEPISKRHRIDEDALADGNEVGKRRRGNAYGSSEETAVDGEGANGEDSASKLILESLEEMAPPPSSTLSLGLSGSDFSFGEPFGQPVPPPTVVVHHIPKPSPAASLKTASKVREVKAVIAAGSKPKSALVNARISDLKPVVGGTPSRPSDKNTGSLKFPVTAAPTVPPAGSSSNNSTGLSFPVISSIPNLGGTPSAGKDKISASIPTFPSFGTPIKAPASNKEAGSIVTAIETPKKAPESAVKPAFGFGVPKSSTPAAKTTTTTTAAPASTGFSFEKTDSPFKLAFNSNSANGSTSGVVASVVKPVVEREKSPVSVAPVIKPFVAPTVAAPPPPTANAVSFENSSLNASVKAGASVWVEVSEMPVSALPKFDFGSSPVSTGFSLYLNNPEFLELGVGSTSFEWESSSSIDTTTNGGAFGASSSSSLSKPAVAAVAGISGGEKWTCDSCMVPNNGDVSICVCCETAKPGSAAVVAPAVKSLFSSSSTVSTSSVAPAPASGGGFSFTPAAFGNSTEMPGGFNFGSSSSVGGGSGSGGKGGFSFGSGFGNSSASTKPVAKEWICERCLVVNKDALSVECESCGKARPGFEDAKKKANENEKKWVCEKCLVENEAGNSKCVQCDLAKPVVVVAAAAAASGFGRFSFSFGQK